jgi:hypothetical protein
MKHIKLFENFSREYLKTNNNSLVAFYVDKLGDFWLEKDLLEKLEKFESRVDSLFSDSWNVNRGRGQYNGDYFALNVKVYNYPDEDEVQAKIGIELDEVICFARNFVVVDLAVELYEINFVKAISDCTLFSICNKDDSVSKL